MRRLAGKTIEILDGEGSIAVRPAYLQGGAERHKRNSEVGRMSSYAGVTGAQNGMTGVHAIDCRAARAWSTLVAGRVEHAKIRTARTLQQVATDGRHIAKLRRGSFQQRF